MMKFQPLITFADFKAENIDTITKEKLDFKSNPNAIHFKTRITEAYKERLPNFAGHYTLAFWGCGAPCQSGILIDRITGKMYNIPMANLGYDHKVDSRMLLVNLPDENQEYPAECSYCKPIIYVFDESSKKFIEHLINR